MRITSCSPLDLNSGLLTVEANDDTTAARDANTSGTLFGAMETGPDDEK